MAYCLQFDPDPPKTTSLEGRQRRGLAACQAPGQRACRCARGRPRDTGSPIGHPTGTSEQHRASQR
jgi:hypothetical protein